MSLIRFIFYSFIAYLVIRFVMRLISPQNPRPQPQPGQTRTKANPSAENFDKPKYTIEAEVVDYEIIEEPKRKNEE